MKAANFSATYYQPSSIHKIGRVSTPLSSPSSSNPNSTANPSPTPSSPPKMNLQNYLTACFRSADNLYPTHDNGWYQLLDSQPALPAPMRYLPLALTSSDHRTARTIRDLLVHAPPLSGPDITQTITNTLSLPPEDYTPRLAEHLLRALEETFAADKKETWGRLFDSIYYVAEDGARDSMWTLWRVAEGHRLGEHDRGEAARTVWRVLALGILLRMAPEFVRVLGWTGGEGEEWVQKGWFFWGSLFFSVGWLLVDC